MNVLELDEAQGLTAEMVREWLRNQEPRIRLIDGYWTWNPDALSLDKQGPCLGDAVLGFNLEQGVLMLTVIESRRPQALLRDINQRVAWWPSDEARAAHSGYWLCVVPEDGTSAMGKFDGRWFRHSGNCVIEKADRWARFWPCDGFAQRVRWPERDGVML